MHKKFSTYSDKELAELLKSDRIKSEKAFTEIYDRYSQKIFAYCLRVLGNKELAEDIFQETFLRFFQHIDPTHEKLNIQRFLIRIARNLCLNYKRNSKINIPIEEIDNLIEQDRNTDEKEYQDLIKYAIELLELEYKEPLVLRVYNEISYDEIAEILNITPGNARIRVHRAKEKLKDILSPYIKDLENNR